MSKVIIFSAPSGSGKTTIVKHLLQEMSSLEFSISATSRPLRAGEVNGQDYYFLTAEEFKQKIEANEFIEWEQVYENKFYGTLNSEPERIWSKGKQVLFDVDVYGGLSLKKKFGNRALLIFIMPPSVEELHRRLVTRATDSPEIIAERVAKADLEMSFAPKFDKVIINDTLQTAIAEARAAIDQFIRQ